MSISERLNTFYEAEAEYLRVRQYWNAFRVSTNPAKAEVALETAARGVQRALQKVLGSGAPRGRPKGSKGRK